MFRERCVLRDADGPAHKEPSRLSEPVIKLHGVWKIFGRRTTAASSRRSGPRCVSPVHTALDAAVAEAYGWPEGIADEEALGELLALNDGCNVQQT